jgi:hypothetical protein
MPISAPSSERIEILADDQVSPLLKARLAAAGAIGESTIFPHFDITVPMPSGTAVPPKVTIIHSKPPLGAPFAGQGSGKAPPHSDGKK